MSCNTTYCISNTGLVGADDNYITGGTYNGDTYWTGQTSGWTIYYYTGITSYWCLSDTLGGTCYLTGKYPCVSTCPDLSSVYVFSGMCPTPTPTPTQNCDVLDFTALFDCEYIPIPTPTPSTSVTPTPTITPTTTNFCSIIGIDAIAYTYTSTPTPTPTVTPTQYDENSFNRRQFYSRDIPRNCPIYGHMEYTPINGEIICPGSLKFQDCFNGDYYYTINFNVPAFQTLQQYGVYGAYVDGVKKCVAYLGNSNNGPQQTLIYESGLYGYLYDDGACTECQIPLSSPTPTPTITITPTPTLTRNYIPPTPSPSPTLTQGYIPPPSPTPTVTQTSGLPSPSPTPTNTQTTTPTPSITPTATPNCFNGVNDVYERESITGFTIPYWIVPDFANNYFVSDGSRGVKYFVPPTNSQQFKGYQAFTFSYNGNSNWVSTGPMAYNSFSNTMYVCAGSGAGIFALDLNSWTPGTVIVSSDRISTDYVVGSVTTPQNVRTMVYNSVNDRIYFTTEINNNAIGYIQCSTGIVTYLNTATWGIYTGDYSLEYNPIRNEIYLLGGSSGAVLGNWVKIVNCGSNNLVNPGIPTGGDYIHSLSYKPGSDTLYVLMRLGQVYEMSLSSGYSLIPWSPPTIGFGNFGSSTYNTVNDKIYISDNTNRRILVADTNTQTITQVLGLNPSYYPYRLATYTTTNKVFVSQIGGPNRNIIQICASA